MHMCFRLAPRLRTSDGLELLEVRIFLELCATSNFSMIFSRQQWFSANEGWFNGFCPIYQGCCMILLHLLGFLVCNNNGVCEFWIHAVRIWCWHQRPFDVALTSLLVSAFCKQLAMFLLEQSCRMHLVHSWYLTPLLWHQVTTALFNHIYVLSSFLCSFTY